MSKTNYFATTSILVPFDFSDVSVDAVQTASLIANRNEQITVLHLVDPAHLYGLDDNEGYSLGGGMHSAMIDVEGTRQIDETCEQRTLLAMQDRLAASTLEGIRFAVLVEDPKQGIIQYAVDHDAGLIVIPSHGLAGIKRQLIGSVTDQVVRGAHCPVLVLRSPTDS